MMTGTETMNQHTILATRLGDLTVVRNAEAVVGRYFPHHWYMPGPDTFGPRTDEGFDEVERQTQGVSGRRVARVRPAAPGPRQRAAASRVGSGSEGALWADDHLSRPRPAPEPDVTPQQIGADISRNPLCILIPCHRVVGTNGKLTGYAGGLERKRALLELEQLASGPIPHEALVTVGG